MISNNKQLTALILCGVWGLLAPSQAMADFPEFQLSWPKAPSPVPGPRQSIEITGSTVLIRGVTGPENQVFVNGAEVTVGPDGAFDTEMIVPVGETEVVVEARDAGGKTRRITKTVQARENHFFMVGIADGTLHLVDTSRDYDLRAGSDSFGDGTHMNAKASYYLAAKVKGKYLVKSGLDTDKATQEKLFSRIDPDRFYPVYGDRSSADYDAPGQGKFYLKMDWENNGLVVGNFRTQRPEGSSRLASYDRTLYGAKLDLVSKDRNVYGDPEHAEAFFLSEANQRQGRSEFMATGNSLYYLRHRNIVEGSQRVRLQIRDKFTRRVLATVPQEPGLDYDFKDEEGRILFRRPVSSVALSDTVSFDSIQEGHEVYIVADYEYRDQDAFRTSLEDRDHLSGGLRLTRGIGEHFMIGGEYAEEQREGKHHRIYGIEGTAKFGNFTRFSAEYAATTAGGTSSFLSYNGGYDYTEIAVANRDKGHAFRFEADLSLGEWMGREREFFELSGFYQTIDKNFSAAETLYQAGKKIGDRDGEVMFQCGFGRRQQGQQSREHGKGKNE